MNDLAQQLKEKSRLAVQLATQRDRLRDLANALLDRLDNITTEEFSRGGEREQREALRKELKCRW